MEFEWDPRKAEYNLKNMVFHSLRQEQSLATNLQLQFLTLITQTMKTALLRLAGQIARDY